MGKVNCETVNIEGMRVPVDHVMIELRLPVDGLHAGEIGDPGFRVTSCDIYGLPRAENMEDWENTEASLRALLGSSVYDGLSAFEKEVLLRGTPLGHGRYTFLLKVESSGKSSGPEVTVADLRKLGRFSPRAHVYADPVSGARVFRTYLADGEQLDYRSVLGAPVAFDAKKARGAAGRRGKRPGEVWDAARGNPAVLEMLLDGISPGSSNRTARIKGTRRANAQQMAWILQSPGADDCVHEVLSHTHEVLEEWTTDDDRWHWWRALNDELGYRRRALSGIVPREIATNYPSIARGLSYASLDDRKKLLPEFVAALDALAFEQYFERVRHYNAQDKGLDKGLRLVRGLADLVADDPGVLTGSMEGETPEMRKALRTILKMSTEAMGGPASMGRTGRVAGPDLIALAAALGYVSAQQAVSIRDAAATFAPSSTPTTPNSDDAAAVNPSTTEEVLAELAQASSEEPSVGGKTDYIVRMRKEAGTFVNPGWGPPEPLTGPWPVTGPDGVVTRFEMLPYRLPDVFTREDVSPKTLEHMSPKTLEHMVDALAEKCATPTSDFEYLEDAVEVLHMIGDNPAISEDLYEKVRKTRLSLEPITERKKNEYVVSWEAKRRSEATKNHSELYKKSQGTLLTGLRHLRAGERTRAAKFLKRELVEAALACSTDPEEIRALAAFAQTLPAPAPQSYNKPILLHRETQWWTVVEEDARGRCALGNPATPPDVIQSFIAAGIINDKEGARQLLMDGPRCDWYDILSVARSYRSTVRDLENLLEAAQDLLSSARSVEFARGGWSDALPALLEHPNATPEQKARATELLHQRGSRGR